MSFAFSRALPPALERLRDLAGDLRWTWSHTADNLWRTIDPASWERSENPWSILQNAPSERLEQLARDDAFLAELGRLDDARKHYLAGHGWFGDHFPNGSPRCVAFFCMEFGLAEALPLYAGGLGVLAGDYLKAASDLGVPAVGVGLLYQEGYFRQAIDETGRQQETFPYNDPTTLPIEPVLTNGGEWLRVSLAFPGRRLHVRVWRARVGRAMLYLLDTNDPLNSPIDRGITSKLYQGSPVARFLQQVVIGVAGWRVLDALGLPVDVCHLNEGHAAFAILERAHACMQRTGLDFWEALWATRAGNVFTTHTPVDAAFDRFNGETVASFAPYFRDYVARLGIDVRDLMALGRQNPADANEPFTPAYLAIRGSGYVNGVSRLHGQVSRRLFHGLFPRWPEREVPVAHVTNGVHVPSWDSPAMDALWENACGKERWRGELEMMTDAVRCISDEQLWAAKAHNRERLVHVVRARLARQLGFRGADAASIERAGHIFDPNTLTLGFARRFAEYKRPNLLLRDADRFERILANAARPVQIVVAGKAYPADWVGAALVREWIQFAARPGVRDRVVFLEDYDITLAEELVRGVDVWLNTPRPPFEACGTSGMKVLANGGLNASTFDGWWAEAYRPDAGWCVGDSREHVGGDADETHAAVLYDLLEHEIIPAFYERDAQGLPLQWLDRMRSSMAELAPRFSANRMVREYVTDIYVPAARLAQRRVCEGGRLGKELHAWHKRLERDWRAIRFGQLEVTESDAGRVMAVPVYLGALEPSDVAVELYADPLGAEPAVCLTMDRARDLPGAVHGALYRAEVPLGRPGSDYTPRVIASHPDARVPLEAGFITWYR